MTTPADLLFELDKAMRGIRAPGTWERMERLVRFSNNGPSVISEALGHVRRACNVVAAHGGVTNHNYAEVYGHLGRARACLVEHIAKRKNAAASSDSINELLTTLNAATGRFHEPATWQELESVYRRLRKQLPPRPVTLEESVALSCCLDLADACAEKDIAYAFHDGIYMHAHGFVQKARRALTWYLNERDTGAPAPELREA